MQTHSKRQLEEVPAYFGAGPALLPTNVLLQAANDLIIYSQNPVGVGEISHRSKDGVDIVTKTKSQLSKILNIPDTHDVFFMQGGGTGGFSLIATNLLAAFAKKTGKKGRPAYAITGVWSKKAFEEAERLGLDPVCVTNGDPKTGKFTTIDSVSNWKKLDPNETPYLFYCDNETVHGVEFQTPPIEATQNGQIELVTDMSSNFLSKEIDVSKYGLIFAGAQKNVGIAGISIYIIKKSLIDQATTNKLHELNIPITPIAFHFPTVIKNDSMYNTIPIFNVHILNLVTKHLIEQGTLKQKQVENEIKAKLLYECIETYPELFTLPVDKRYRSKMNVVFTINTPENEAKFLKEATNNNICGLKGHRSVGGIRASIYNAIDLNTTKKLISFINEFSKLVNETK